MRKKIALLTAGPTREYLDPVRYLSNASSGRMGFALARELKSLGFRVSMVLGPGIDPPPGIAWVRVVSARQMLQEVSRHFPRCDVFISCAAVSDFRPASPSRKKIHRREKSLAVRLVPNPDILREMGRRKKKQICVGFALEDRMDARRAFAKMRAKNCDLMVLNSVDSIESGRISATLLFKDQRAQKLGKISKTACAKMICRAILKSRA